MVKYIQERTKDQQDGLVLIGLCHSGLCPSPETKMVKEKHLFPQVALLFDFDTHIHINKLTNVKV